MSNKSFKNFGGEPAAKKSRCSIISEHVESAELQESFFEYWHSLKPIKTDKIEIITSPYRICKISNFLKDDTLISRIIDELKDVERGRKDMDLYQFEQTEDLANVKSKSISDFYKTFKSDVTDWMKKNTGISLSGKISMSSSTYSDTDYLLCHDDNMGDRRIAFIFYLSKNWTPQDGGALDIFDTDENGQPKDVVRSLTPEYNSLVFFEVVDNSYHQVGEVTSPDRLRLSINGWFHGPLRDGNKQRRLELTCRYFEPEHAEVDVTSYVSKIYLYETIVENIQKTIEKDSFIYLPDFLISEKYQALCDEVKSEKIKWQKVGPADLQNYEIASEDSLPQELKKFYNIFKSIHLFHLLKQYTELDLVPETSEMTPKVKIELQRWSRGCYMLINDKEANKSTNDVGEETENSSAVNCRDVDLTAEADLEQHEKADDKVLNKSQNGKTEGVNSDAIKSIATRSGDSIPGKKVCNTLQEGCEPKIEPKFASRKGKVLLPNCKNVPEIESTMNLASESRSSDVEDYLSDAQSNSESEISETDGEEKDTRPGTLDVLLQFHTNNVTEDATIDYIDPSQKDGALIHIPPQDNHLCLVYRTADTCRCNKYINHYCKGYFYTLVCSYYE